MLRQGARILLIVERALSALSLGSLRILRISPALREDFRRCEQRNKLLACAASGKLLMQRSMFRESYHLTHNQERRSRQPGGGAQLCDSGFVNSFLWPRGLRNNCARS